MACGVMLPKCIGLGWSGRLRRPKIQTRKATHCVYSRCYQSRFQLLQCSCITAAIPLYGDC